MVDPKISGYYWVRCRNRPACCTGDSYEIAYYDANQVLPWMVVFCDERMGINQFEVLGPVVPPEELHAKRQTEPSRDPHHHRK